MPNYDICYLDGTGSLIGKISAECVGPKEAAVLAHAMKFRAWLQVEVWEGEKLTYERRAALVRTPFFLRSRPHPAQSEHLSQQV